VDGAIWELEQVAAGHWRAAEEERLGDWLLRAARGFTGRANSALATGDPGLPLDDALAAVTDWYRARGLPPMIAVPMPLPDQAAPPHLLDGHLAERSWPARSGPAFVMTCRTDVAAGPPGLRPGLELRTEPEPDEAWLAMYHYRGQDLPPVARDLLLSAPWQSFVAIHDAGGAPAAIARVSVSGGWAGITAVEVARSRRRQGLGTAITRAACAEAARQGADHVFLQVEVCNTAALSLYERCGFRYSHWYQYRVGPAR
jgi:GNAT superfamily N-acetyltransferase